jgi:hypothetical protein
MERNVLKERLVNKDDKNRHCVLLIIDISKHGAKEMCPVFVKQKKLYITGKQIYLDTQANYIHYINYSIRQDSVS